jgi:outer membrane protein TolC
MKTTAFKKLLITFIALVSWLSGNSQHYPDSLLKYLEIAAQNNPAVQQRFSEYQASLQKVPQAGSLSDPELSLGVFLKPMELVSGNQVADIRLMQMFPWFGVLKNARDEMSLMANSKFELFRDSKLQAFYDVQRTWYELFKIQKSITISEKNIEILKIIERLALVRFKSAESVSPGTTSSNTGMSFGSAQSGSTGSSGMQAMGTGQANSGFSASKQPTASMQTASMSSSSGSPGLADLYRIQIETGELENNIALLKNQEQSIIASFNSYLNRPPDTPVFTGDTLNSDSLGLSLISVLDSILSKNPMLSMLEFEKQSYEVRKKMVTGMGYPMVGLGLDYSLINKNEMSTSSMNGKDMVMPMITVTLPIYRKKYTAMINEADLLKTATSQNYQAAANSLQTDYYQAVQLYKDAQRRIKLYENQFQLASKSFDLILKSFSTSSSGLSDVLRVQQQMLDYEFKQVEAVTDFNTAIAWLNRLMAFPQIQ